MRANGDTMLGKTHPLNYYELLGKPTVLENFSRDTTVTPRGVEKQGKRWEMCGRKFQLKRLETIDISYIVGTYGNPGADSKH